MSNSILACAGVEKTYGDFKNGLTIFKNIDFSIAAGETVAIVGSSGAGKTTLLNILGGLDAPTCGCVRLKGDDLQSLSEKQRCLIRNKQLGFVYQFHHLLPEFSALENVCMPLLIGGGIKEGKARAVELLGKVGLQDRLSHKPAQLSGGERQRVAIARSLINNPSCVLMDEPTGNLDEATAESVKHLLWQLTRDFTTSFVLVTHDSNVADSVEKVYRLEAGNLKLTNG
ncbi:MAG: lipoprotein-releasing system ATP-binding protein LolD [Gammaproteobacteria bacterium]|nr:MAG: lipoprotein-releasing system ATP-binding protein LolD [Gammaproteobacteria bacterium]